VRRLSRCAIEPAELPGGENLRGGKRLRLRFWKGCLLQHAYPFALNRPLVASLQLCSQSSFALPLDVRPLSLDSPVPSLVLRQLANVAKASNVASSLDRSNEPESKRRRLCCCMKTAHPCSLYKPSSKQRVAAPGSRPLKCGMNLSKREWVDCPLGLLGASIYHDPSFDDLLSL
jgi:hypothetical protein